MPDYDPLLITLKMDETSFQHFDSLRKAYFPPERNHIPAHITFFHHLHAGHKNEIIQILQETALTTAAFSMQTSGLMFLGFGTAYIIASEQAQALRGLLAERFDGWLTPQDRNRPFKPHITVQNKINAEQAKATYATLQTGFQPEVLTAIGLDLWEYKGGPWRHKGMFGFKG